MAEDAAQEKLPIEEIRILERWVARGAVDPRTGIRLWAGNVGGPTTGLSSPFGRAGSHRRQKPPSWIRTPIDSFVLSRLGRRRPGPLTTGRSPGAGPPGHLRPHRTASHPRTGGNIPGRKPGPGAWGRLVDRLLGSPHYGARWGRHWLDVARYADSNGLDENVAHGNAWRYRDWVIDSLNADRPFDSFVRDQLAGDRGPGRSRESEQQRHRRMIATGFLPGPQGAGRGRCQEDGDGYRRRTGRHRRPGLHGPHARMARCHDHKFDPVSTRDYYALAGVFQSTRTMEHFNKVARWWENPIATAADQQRLKTHKTRIAEKKAAIDAIVEAATKVVGDVSPHRGQGETKAGRHREAIPRRHPQYAQASPPGTRDAARSHPRTAHRNGGHRRTVTNPAVHIRGSHLDLGESVPRGVPEVIAGPGAKTLSGQTERSAGTGRLADPAGQSSDGPRLCQSSLAVALRPRTGRLN
ncbi:MAG: hypothetical protein Ct9H300mP1_37670 [Planctomycetaceae bacterium]|nr:MAG: hypothetical protein Ct9H300mP1_37670 [Planctomycetaceae bacterium]